MQFFPHPLLQNAHAMTIVPAFQRSSIGNLSSTERLLIDVSPDSKVLVQLDRPKERRADEPLIVLVHGLEASGASPYMLSLADKAVTMGFSAARLNLRNCGDTLHLTPTLYNAGLSQDLIAVVDYLRAQYQFKKVFIIGYSLGGNIVLKAAAELGAAAAERISGACAVSPSIDLKASVVSMERGVNRFYELRFLGGLKDKIRKKAQLFPERFDVSKLKRVTGIRSFDELYTAPDAGFRGADHYYEESSSLAMMDRVSVPTLIIAAQDDPIVPFDAFRDPIFKSNYIKLLCPEHGGHGGFIHKEIEANSSLKSRDRFWAENRVLEFCFDAARK